MKNLKELGKQGTKLLTTLSSQDKDIFTFSEAQKVTNGSSVATRSLLSRLVRDRWIIRLVPGKYLIVPLSAGEEGEHSENWYIIAKNLVEPAPYYISHYGALDVHEMITHPALTVFVSTPSRKPSKKVLGATYRFIYTQAKDIWGIEEVWVTTSQKVKVSDLERTIVDCLDRPDLSGGISEIAKGLWTKRNDIDYKKLLKYTKKLGRKSVAKRLGFLLENYNLGSSRIIEELRKMVESRSYSPLDPTLPKTGKYISSWKLRINIEPDELIAITQT